MMFKLLFIVLLTLVISPVFAALDYVLYDNFNVTQLNHDNWETADWSGEERLNESEIFRFENGKIKMITDGKTCNTWNGGASRGCASKLVFKENLQIPVGIRTTFQISESESHLSELPFQARITLDLRDEKNNPWVCNFSMTHWPWDTTSPYHVELHCYFGYEARTPEVKLRYSISKNEVYANNTLGFEIDRENGQLTFGGSFNGKSFDTIIAGTIDQHIDEKLGNLRTRNLQIHRADISTAFWIEPANQSNSVLEQAKLVIKIDKVETAKPTSTRAAILIQPNVGEIVSQEKAVNFMANYAYKILQQRGYNNDNIYFLSYTRDLDVNADGNAVDSIITTVSGIQAAFNWAKGKGKLDTPLVIIFVSHGMPNQLILEQSSNQTLKAQIFKSILDDYQNATGNQVVAILEACYTGTLVPTLAGTNRIIISSTSENRSFYMDSGEISFLKFYLDQLKHGEYFLPAWQSVKKELSLYKWPPSNEKQVPQLKDISGTLAQQLCLGDCFGSLPGTVLTVTELPPIVLFGQSIDLTAFTQIPFGDIQKVTASLLTPTMNFDGFGHSEQSHMINFNPVNTRHRNGKKQWQGRVHKELLTTPGSYTLTIKAYDDNGFIIDKPITFEVTPATRLINLSTRASIQGGANDVIAGFIITGSGTQKVIIRGWGLEAGVNPKLTLQKYPSGELVAINDNWQTDSRVNEIPAHLVLPNPTDAGLLLDLPVGAYTALLSSVGTPGLGLIGVDEVEPSDTAKLINLSTRAPIQGGANDIIAGLIITGTGTKKVMLRGFALEAGVNPKLTLQKYPSGEFVASNDDWQIDSRFSEIPEHLKLPNPTDAGLLLDLPVGAYTVTLSSVGAKGLGLVGVDAIE